MIFTYSQAIAVAEEKQRDVTDNEIVEVVDKFLRVQAETGIYPPYQIGGILSLVRTARVASGSGLQLPADLDALTFCERVKKIYNGSHWSVEVRFKDILSYYYVSFDKPMG